MSGGGVMRLGMDTAAAPSAVLATSGSVRAECKVTVSIGGVLTLSEDASAASPPSASFCVIDRSSTRSESLRLSGSD
jgi:hypothetical protein